MFGGMQNSYKSVYYVGAHCGRVVCRQKVLHDGRRRNKISSPDFVAGERGVQASGVSDDGNHSIETSQLSPAAKLALFYCRYLKKLCCCMNRRSRNIQKYGNVQTVSL